MDPSSFRAFFSAEDLTTEIVEGDVERVVYTGARLQIIEYRFPPDKRFSAHSHAENEQMGFLVSGRMGFRVGDEELVLGPGDWYHAPIGVQHSARTFEEASVLVDVFAPPRHDILTVSNHWVAERDGGAHRSDETDPPGSVPGT